jgi:formylmethanofuran dehydrogenase subunit E
MTEEERQRTIRELEEQVFSDKPYSIEPNKRSKKNKKEKCEVCGGELINGDCPEHAVHIRMHHNYLMRMREQHGK